MYFERIFTKILYCPSFHTIIHLLYDWEILLQTHKPALICKLRINTVLSQSQWTGNGVIFSSHIISIFIVQNLNKKQYLCVKNITNLITLAITWPRSSPETVLHKIVQLFKTGHFTRQSCLWGPLSLLVSDSSYTWRLSAAAHWDRRL